MLALGAPEKLWLNGETSQGLELVRTQYRRAGREKALEIFNGEPAQSRKAALHWLLSPSGQ
jgi:hypothetical protein